MFKLITAICFSLLSALAINLPAVYMKKLIFIPHIFRTEENNLSVFYTVNESVEIGIIMIFFACAFPWAYIFSSRRIRNKTTKVINGVAQFILTGVFVTFFTSLTIAVLYAIYDAVLTGISGNTPNMANFAMFVDMLKITGVVTYAVVIIGTILLWGGFSIYGNQLANRSTKTDK